MRAWIVNPFEHDFDHDRAYRYPHLCRLLAARGHEVTFFGSAFCHRRKHDVDRREAEAAGRRHGYAQRLLAVPPYRRNVGGTRLWSHHRFSRSLAKSLAQQAATAPPSVIFTNSIPLESAETALRFGRQCGVPVCVDVQDLWPEAFQVLPLTRLFPASAVIAWWLRREDTIFAGAQALTAVCRAYLDRAMAKGDQDRPHEVVRLGYDLAWHDQVLGSAEDDLPPDEPPVVGYAGSFQRHNDVETIVRAMALLERRDARLVLLGDGAERAPLARLAGSLGLANRVEFTGWLDPISLAGRLRRCLVTVISVASKSSIAFPNKIGDYAAAGRAIVSGVGGELEKLLRAYDAGVCYRAGDPADLARQLDALLGDQERARVMGRHARRLCSEQLDRAQTYPRLVALLEELAGD